MSQSFSRFIGAASALLAVAFLAAPAAGQEASTQGEPAAASGGPAASGRDIDRSPRDRMDRTRAGTGVASSGFDGGSGGRAAGSPEVAAAAAQPTPQAAPAPAAPAPAPEPTPAPEGGHNPMPPPAAAPAPAPASAAPDPLPPPTYEPSTTEPADDGGEESPLDDPVVELPDPAGSAPRTPSPTPEPSSLLLMGTGLAALYRIRRRKP